jgi:hypothetical protein
MEFYGFYVVVYLYNFSNYGVAVNVLNGSLICNEYYQSMFDNIAVVVDLLDLPMLKVSVRDILGEIGVRCVLVNSSGDKSENFVIP